ncbi:MAG: hypothetical protein AAGA03_14740 [Planctomycetota bacterium]
MPSMMPSLRSLSVLTALGLAWVNVPSASAQSGTRSYAPSPQPSRASAARVVPSVPTTTQPTALQGYCPVCVVEMKKWVKGDRSHSASHDGKTYLFPSEDQKRMFLADPKKYTPALGGDCAVCLTDMNKRVPGSLRFAALHQDRLFLFPNQEIKQKFLDDPGKYSAADLALGGKCAVCKVEMKQDVMGSPKFMTSYQGMRYQFPGEEQLRMFKANPKKYATSMAAPGGSGTR